jgi:hypothetical protein
VSVCVCVCVCVCIIRADPLEDIMAASWHKGDNI